MGSDDHGHCVQTDLWLRSGRDSVGRAAAGRSRTDHGHALGRADVRRALRDRDREGLLQGGRARHRRLAVTAWAAPRPAAAEQITVTHWGVLMYGAPYAIAIEKGYYKEAGLDIDSWP